jgi:ankyrin repeat protein
MKKNLAVEVLSLFVMASFWSAAAPAAQAPAASVQEPAISGDTELFKAISAGHEGDVRTMLTANPQRAFAKDKNGNSALLFAMYMNQPAITNVILGYRNNDIDVFEAAALGKDEKLHSLISQTPALLSAFAPDGFSALHLASFFGHTSSQEILIAAGANIGAYSKNSLRATPLQSAAAARQLSAARILLEHGADPNCKGEDGYTPLHEAAGTGQIELVRLLIKYGGEISAKGDDGKTPRDIAVQQKQSTEVLSLLNKEAR